VKFGPAPLDEALGGIVAHALRIEGLTLKKGDVVSADHVARLRAAGLAQIVVARLEAGDAGEDEAAAALAQAVAGEGVRVQDAFTGRANLFARHAGVLMVDAPAIDRTTWTKR
jgi:molybdenum cofactor cytidylyltransferase